VCVCVCARSFILTHFVSLECPCVVNTNQK